MNPRSETWLVTLGVAAATGAVSLYVKVKNAAVRHLADLGAFQPAEQERMAAFQQLPASAQNPNRWYSQQHAVGLSIGDERPRWVDSAAVRGINQLYQTRKQGIIQQHGADSFAGAWRMLSPKEKNKALMGSSINAIIAGGVTYALAHASRKGPGGGSPGGSNSCGAGWDSCGFWGGGHGHGCFGHGGCGGHGCFGGH